MAFFYRRNSSFKNFSYCNWCRFRGGMGGVINLMEGYGNDNPGAKSQGIKQLMAGGGIVLIGMKLIPLLANTLN